jgi:hypothetical protein
VNDDVELQPTGDQVLQEEPPPMEAVPVRLVDVEGPVRTQALPRKTGTTQTRTLTAGAVARRVLTADPYRGSATLIGDQPFYVAFSEHGKDDDLTSAWWPASVPLVITAVVDVWVRAASDQYGVELGIVVERWATGSEHADGTP